MRIERHGLFHFPSWLSHLFELWPAGGPTAGAIDLTPATKLRNIEFRCETLKIEWVARTLETITSKHQDLRQVSIKIPSDLAYLTAQNCAKIQRRIEEANPGMRWSDLDRLLIKLRESHAIRTTVVYPKPEIGEGAKDLMGRAAYLLPELTKKGMVDLVEKPGEPLPFEEWL